MNEFLKNIGGKFGDNWFLVWLTPAIIFCMVGLGALSYAGHWCNIWKLIQKFGDLKAHSQLLFSVGLLIVLVVGAWLIESLTFPLLRALEGYWPSFLGGLRRWLSKRWWVEFQHNQNRLNDLLVRRDKLQKQIEVKGAELQKSLLLVSDEEQKKYEVLLGEYDELLDDCDALDRTVILSPSTQRDCLPTRLGNTLRAAERRPAEKYGLDVAVSWSRIWLLLPEEVKKPLVEARGELDLFGRLWVWSLLCMVWSFWAIWALAFSLLAILIVYRLMLRAARVYGELIEATYDTQRALLYESLRWPFPEDPSMEREEGEALTSYLWRGPNEAVSRWLGQHKRKRSIFDYLSSRKK